ncbi:hypothetical protein B0H11DRAFT_2183884 [Mycena galericulata]|nr:hypothetical protein B0H11DRAFT_2183884 [Mycena galericulata]
MALGITLLRPDADAVGQSGGLRGPAGDGVGGPPSLRTVNATAELGILVVAILMIPPLFLAGPSSIAWFLPLRSSLASENVAPIRPSRADFIRGFESPMHHDPMGSPAHLRIRRLGDLADCITGYLISRRGPALDLAPQTTATSYLPDRHPTRFFSSLTSTSMTTFFNTDKSWDWAKERVLALEFHRVRPRESSWYWLWDWGRPKGIQIYDSTGRTRFAE